MDLFQKNGSHFSDLARAYDFTNNHSHIHLKPPLVLIEEGSKFRRGFEIRDWLQFFESRGESVGEREHGTRSKVLVFEARNKPCERLEPAGEEHPSPLPQKPDKW